MEIRGQRKADASVVHAAIAAMTFVGRPMLLLSHSLRCLLRVTQDLIEMGFFFLCIPL